MAYRVLGVIIEWAIVLRVLETFGWLHLFVIFGYSSTCTSLNDLPTDSYSIFLFSNNRKDALPICLCYLYLGLGRAGRISAQIQNKKSHETNVMPNRTARFGWGWGFGGSGYPKYPPLLYGSKLIAPPAGTTKYPIPQPSPRGAVLYKYRIS